MSEERQQGPGRGGWWKSPWGFGAQGLVGSLWLVGALYVTVSLISDTGEPGVLGSIAAVLVLFLCVAVDRGLGDVPRWVSSRRKAGAASAIAAVVGLAMLAGTVVYGVSYLRTENVFLSEYGQRIEFEGPSRGSGTHAFYVGAEFHVSGCDDPVEVVLAAFPHREAAQAHAGSTGSFTFEVGSPLKTLASDLAFVRSPRTGKRIDMSRSGAISYRLSDGRVTGNVQRSAWDWTKRPIAARFTANLLEKRNKNSCFLNVPLFPDASDGRVADRDVSSKTMDSWTRVTTDSALVVDAEASEPPPTRDESGTPVWQCHEDAGACYGTAVITEKDAENHRDLNLLLMGLLLSLGSAALLEGVLDAFRRGDR
jgi:hypothetical protein